MEEKRLTKIAVLCSLAGILLLLVIAEQQDTSASNIQNITNASIDQTVHMKGKIIALKETPAVTIAQVQDTTDAITVIMFRKEEISLEKGMLVEVEGIVKVYNDELEIEAKRVKVF